MLGLGFLCATASFSFRLVQQEQHSALCSAFTYLPHIEDVVGSAWPQVGVQDQVAITPIELPVRLGIHWLHLQVLNPPHLGNKTSWWAAVQSSWGQSTTLWLPHHWNFRFSLSSCHWSPEGWDQCLPLVRKLWTAMRSILSLPQVNKPSNA